jgi:hypothetical protein
MRIQKIVLIITNKNYNMIKHFQSVMSGGKREDMLKKLEKNVERAAEVYADTPSLYLPVLAIPGIGSIIDTLFRHKASEVLHRRCTELWEATKAEVTRIDIDKIDKSFFESEEGYDLIVKAMHAAFETGNKDKMRLYARILISSGLLDKAKFRYYSKDFISLLLDLLPADLAVAREIYKQQKDTPADITDPEATSEVHIVRDSGFYRTPELLHLEKGEFDFALTKLVRSGLIRQVVGSYVGYNGDAYRITHTFRKMMDLIEDLEYLK